MVVGKGYRMTVIVAVAAHGKVTMGCDGGASDKDFIGSSLTSKVKRNGKYLIGYAGSQGTGQLLQKLEYPMPPKRDLDTFLRTQFVRVAKQNCEELCSDVYDPEKGAADLLVGVHGRLFEISTEDWGVTEWTEIATGSGYQYAMGSLYSTQGFPTAERVRKAVQAAIFYSPTCANNTFVYVN